MTHVHVPKQCVMPCEHAHGGGGGGTGTRPFVSFVDLQCLKK